MSANPVEGDLVVRRIPFEFPDDLNPRWNPRQHEWSHMVNGASLVMPYLEPFLIHTMREAIKQFDDPLVLEEARGFIAQEAQHYKAHRRYNEVLKANGYPQLADVEAAMDRSYERMKARRSLAFRQAYSCGFESMTLGLTRWLISDRVKLFAHSDSRVASFILWHMVEEIEHKRVAYDVYQAACGGYWQRCLGVFTGSLDVFRWSRRACITMLKADGVWRDLRSRMRLWRRTAEFAATVLPGALRSALPGHDPRREPDPQWVRDWISGYSRRSDDAVPLLDTSNPILPIPFVAIGAS